MKIAILGTMSEEITPLLETLKNYTKIEHASNTYYFVNYKNHEFILTYSKIDRVDFTLSASVVTEKFGMRVLLFTGVAGVFSSGLGIGDLFYAIESVQHDLDITAFGHSSGFVLRDEIFIKTDDKLNNLVLEVAKELGIRLRVDTIAADGEFICDEAKKAKIRKIFNADAYEIKGTSITLVCGALKVPCSILRVMSDKTDEKAEFDSDEFVINSAKISTSFVLKMRERL